MESDQKIIQLKNIHKRFKVADQSITVLRNVWLDINAGEFVAIVGPSGNGKSTLLNMVTGIDRPSEGQVFVNGIPVHNLKEDQLAAWRAEQVGIIFQFFQLLPALNLLQNVILPMDFLRRYSAKERRERAEHLLEMVGLQDQMHKLPSRVSGGQQQRAAIARALANDPSLVVADEPTGNLDARTSEEVFDLFSHLVDQGKTLLMVTHDEHLACRVPRRIEIINGMIAQDGSCQDEYEMQGEVITASEHS